ncbi:MAG: ATP-binding protein [Sulfurimonas sp.]|nr:ATP-binding protein [Sulfurimonas sp.]
MKFTKHGEIKMSVARDSFNDLKNEADISICIEDSGIGIADENKEKIFKIFESREASNTIHYEGTGLGLSINKKLANLMDGDIEVRSELLVGSKFTLLLNNVEVILASTTKEIKEEDIDFSLIKKSRILVLDDQESSLEIVKVSFENSSSDIYAFSNARDAIDFLKNTEIDLLLINVDILTMDDGAVSKVINKLISVPVISLVNSRLRDIDFHKSGMQPIAHIKKPLKKIDLFRVLLKVLNSQDLDLKGEDTLKIKEVPLSLSFERNKLASIEYFKGQAKEMDELLYEAMNTNDLNSIEKFAGLMAVEASKYQLITLEIFSRKLLACIEAFDIQEVDKMLNEYTSKSRDFRREESLL